MIFASEDRWRFWRGIYVWGSREEATVIETASVFSFKQTTQV